MEMISQEKIRELVGAARTVREKAYAPYSGFKVGAAVLASSGAIFTGCNVENASFGLTICAERSAVVCAVASGERKFHALAIVSDAPEPAPPCGACLQVLVEFAGDIPVILENREGKRIVHTLHQLMPHQFHFRKEP